MESIEGSRLAVRCTVRGCGRDLFVEPGGGWGCAEGHRFDRARAGYVNLLQPQDSRSKHPGDLPETVAARVRMAASGCEGPLHEAIAAWLGASAGAPRRLLEIGCGTGELLARLAGEEPLEAYGLDLTARGLREAARRTRDVRWFCANADRGLPFAEGSLDLVLTVKAPKPFEEISRVLRPGGRALVAVPAQDDLAELREATAGGALPRDPEESARRGGQEAGLRPVASWVVRTRRSLPGPLGRDLLAVGYRGARRSEAAGLPGEGAQTVTLATALIELVRPNEPEASRPGEDARPVRS